MQLFYCDHFVLELPEGHRFPMSKYRRLRERSEAAGGFALAEPSPVDDAQLLAVHTRDYVERVVAGRLDRHEVRALGFPWSHRLVARSRRSVGGTLAAARAALAGGAAGNLAGGTHHAQTNAPQGYCVFNDCAVAARTLQHEGAIARALVLDTDVHQGNGTAQIFADDPSVTTVSLHGARNFPARKAAGDIDRPLAEGTGDAAYLAALDEAWHAGLARGRPDIVFYVAGADAYVDDRLGHLALTKQGLAERDARVVAHCRAAGLPVAVVMAGGYAPEVDDIVDIHLTTLEQVATLAGRPLRPETLAPEEFLYAGEEPRQSAGADWDCAQRRPR